MAQILCIDFDGVIHSYTSGWKGPAVITDPPVDGAIQWLKDMVESKAITPQIYSSRSKNEAGIRAMKEYIAKHADAQGLGGDFVHKLKFPTQKPAASWTLDDRAICFEGTFPKEQELLDFKPWNKR